MCLNPSWEGTAARTNAPLEAFVPQAQRRGVAETGRSTSEPRVHEGDSAGFEPATGVGPTAFASIRSSPTRTVSKSVKTTGPPRGTTVQVLPDSFDAVRDRRPTARSLARSRRRRRARHGGAGKRDEKLLTGLFGHSLQPSDASDGTVGGARPVARSAGASSSGRFKHGAS